MVTQALNDVGVGEAIEKPLIDLVADGFGKASDFAVAAVGERGGRFGRGSLGGGSFGIGCHESEKVTQIYSDLVRFTQI